MAHHYPTLPVGVMQIHVPWQVSNAAGHFYGVQRAVFSFINQNPIPPGWNPGPNLTALTTAWIFDAFLNVQPFDTVWPSNWVFIQGPSNFFVQHNVDTPPTGSTAFCLDPALCACYSKFALPISRNTTGRMHLLPVPKNYLVAGGYNALGKGTYEARIANLMAPITLNTVIFSPAIYSVALDDYFTLDHIRFVPQPVYLYRRRPGRDRFASSWAFVP